MNHWVCLLVDRRLVEMLSVHDVTQGQLLYLTDLLPADESYSLLHHMK